MNVKLLDKPLYVDEGLRVILVEECFIYVVRESDSRMFRYDCDLWVEWLTHALTRPQHCNHPQRIIPEHSELGPMPCLCSALTIDLVPYAHQYTPVPMNMTLDEFIKGM